MIIAILAACGAALAVVLIGAATGATRRPGSAAELASAGSGRGFEASKRIQALALAAVGAFAGVMLAGPPGLVGGLAAGGIPFAIERRATSRRTRRVEEQLIDAVAAIASALRSGRSLVQALALAGEEVGAPLGDMLGGAADRVELGVRVDRVLDELAMEIGGPDARLFTGVLRLHRRTGGALAASLDDLARTLRARHEGARELRSLTAQARLSAVILGLLPLGFFLFLSVVARRDVESAYRTSAGASAIAVGLALQGAAFVWIRRLLRVEDA